ncbi:MAG: ribonuclease Z [Firmicutes bacterium]|nr:ribonuclease Z [Bacillota bacterium]
MEVIICLDDKGGMLFNGRRQSRDRALVEDVLQHCAGRRLLIGRFSAALFPDDAADIVPDEELLTLAGDTDVCFVEAADPAAAAGRIERLTVYRWNRVYPADSYCDIDLTGWRLAETADFVGTSHDKITREVYER